MLANYRKTLFKNTRKSHYPMILLISFITLIEILSINLSQARSQNLNIKGEDYTLINSNTSSYISSKFVSNHAKQNLVARYGLTFDGLSGLFVTDTAEKIGQKSAIGTIKLEYHNITSKYGIAFRAKEKGNALSTFISFNYLGDWAEWSVTVPIHKYDLSAPFTYNSPPSENTGIGNLKLAWKATYLPNKSYYRFAYGTVLYLTVGNSTDLAPAGSKLDDEIKIFGSVSTKESDSATAHLQLGAIINSSGIDNRFIYSFGITYDVTQSAAFITEFSGEIQGENDKDSLDMILGLRLQPSQELNLEFAYTKNLRTYRLYGYDERYHTGLNLFW